MQLRHRYRSRSRRRAMLALIVVAVLVLARLMWSSASPQLILSSNQSGSVSGVFVSGGVPPSCAIGTDVDMAGFSPADLWGSWGADDRAQGMFTSTEFAAPAILDLVCAGYADVGNNRLLLRRADDGATLRLITRLDFEPAGQWHELNWRLPRDWRGKQVQLVAIDGESGLGGWLGVGPPRSLSALGAIARQLPSLLPILLYLISLALFLLPGLAMTSLVASRYRLSPILAVSVLLMSSALAGYAAFWIYFANVTAGQIYSFAVLIGSIALFVYAARNASVQQMVRSIREPFVYMALTGILYLCLLYLFGWNPALKGGASEPDGSYAARRFFDIPQAIDNQLPFLFAEKIYQHKPVKPFLFSDWLSSDRPPLQAGLALLQRPFEFALDPETNYQALGTALQCTWIVAVWALLVAVRARSQVIRNALSFMIFSGPLLYDSVYVWPKLIAATFVLLPLAIMLSAVEDERALSKFEAILVAIGLSLSLLSHPATVFTFPVFPILWFWKRSAFPWSRLAIMSMPALVLLVPWSLYQRVYDPPATRLIKVHLGGQSSITNDTVWEAISNAYRKRSFGTIVGYKLSNFATLIGPQPMISLGADAIRASDGVSIDREQTEVERATQREYIWSALGVLNVGWLVLIGGVFWRKLRPVIPHSGFFLIAAGASIVIWCLILLGPLQTIIACSAYAGLLMLFIGLLGYILALPRPIVWLLFVAQCFNLWIVWIWSEPFGPVPAGSVQSPLLEQPLLVVGVLCAAILVAQLMRNGERNA